MGQHERNINNYASSYLKEYDKNVSFEVILVDVRRKQVLKSLNKYTPKHILEVGCGNEPLFPYLNNFYTYTIVEPSNKFAEQAKKLAKGRDNIKIIPGFMEEVYEELLKSEDFDFIVISSLLHEVQDPEILLQSIHKICKKKTVIHINVPNVYSFHRLLAYEMGTIKSIFEESKTGINLQRQNYFDKKKLFDILDKNDFAILSYGTYFIKPFTNKQMESIINKKIISKDIIKGLENMTKHIPDMGCEMFVEVKIK